MLKLNREILSIAWPAIISNITTPLLAMVDVAIVGHIGSASYIGAIAIGAGMFSMLYMLFGFLRMGSSGLTANAFGAGNRCATDTLFFRALIIGVTAGALLATLCVPISSALLSVMDADDITRPLARSYFLIAIMGAPATLGSFALSGWFLGMQDSRRPMFMALVTNIVNIAMSLIAVFGFGLKIEGVAIGSAVAQWSGFIFGLAYALLRYKPQCPKLRTIFAGNDFRRFFSVNIDIFLRTLCLVIVSVAFTRTGSQQGVDILASNAVLLQFFLLFSYFIDGFAFAGEALAGKYAGRRDSMSLSRLVMSLTRIGIGMAMGFSALYLLVGDGIVAILTNDAEVRGVCNRYLLWASAVPLAGTMAFVWDGIFIGLTRTRMMLFSMLVATAIFFVACALASSLGNHGLWLAFILYLATRGLMQTVMYRKWIKCCRFW